MCVSPKGARPKWTWQTFRQIHTHTHMPTPAHPPPQRERERVRKSRRHPEQYNMDMVRQEMTSRQKKRGSRGAFPLGLYFYLLLTDTHNSIMSDDVKQKLCMGILLGTECFQHVLGMQKRNSSNSQPNTSALETIASLVSGWRWKQDLEMCCMCLNIFCLVWCSFQMLFVLRVPGVNVKPGKLNSKPVVEAMCL